jgi:hypothetical protein
MIASCEHVPHARAIDPAFSRAEGGCRPPVAFGIHKLRSQREERDDLNENIVGERVKVFPYVHWFKVSRLMGAEINARQQRHLGALGAPQVRHQ